MKKMLLTSILALITHTVMADWSLVDENTDGSVTIYTDFGTIQKTENKVKMWSLGDFKTVKEFSGIEFLSSKYQKEYDCKQEQTRMLAFTLFSANMGEGQVVYSNGDPDEWEPVILGSVAKTLWEIACGKLPE
ncbi:surface-adhesin E family protein [Nitrosomonas communis]|uniref:surface-adhesin E family protein n=1 Tax=Nitrosomonas communis TaxID=44574 RepID=UPI0026EA06C9|nr:surface-adhesin E family protein [Nitrosomonas communis]